MSALKKKYKLFWGDLHNHNAVGYAKGSLKRTIDIARENLDFFAFTGHGWWHDMPLMPGDRHMHWVKGFEAHRKHWPKTRQMIKEANDESFVAFLGYEWHSSAFGDYCLIFKEDQPDLFLPDHVAKLLDFARSKNSLAIPHHVAYKLNWRGYNWAYFDPELSPVVEIFSEHGCTMSDRAPYPMILHSNGGRDITNTIEYQLSKGLRFGFVASTDDHFGYPGAFGEGLAGIWAEDLSADSIFEAIRARRTIAVTGDRISIDFSLNENPMGKELPYTDKRIFAIDVESPESIEIIELVKNNRTIKRFFPDDFYQRPNKLPERTKLKFQYGWGPWAALDLERICLWDINISIEGGRFLGAERHFQSGPFAENLRDNLKRISQKSFHLKSYTSRKQAYLEDPTKSIVFEIEAQPNAKVEFEFTEPCKKKFKVQLSDLLEENRVFFTGVFTSESFSLHRLTLKGEYKAQFQWEDDSNNFSGNSSTADLYFLRVRGHNNQWGWSSPIWVESK
ncbi:MAG: hypothetical protein J7K04_12470 [Spirochaetales bacterium]|nr:hypothetical protein [Spirochaetales bacterium]